MRHAFIMDPLEGVKPWKDTTYHLMLAASERGHELFHLSQRDLSLRHDRLVARVRPVIARADHENPFEVGDAETMFLDTMDCVWERTDPPYNRRYFYTSLMLDFLPAETRVINRPSAVRDWNEKLAALKFPDLTPETRVTANVDEIEAFVQELGRITVKPVDGHGGKGVVFVNASDQDRMQKFMEATRDGRHWVIAQAYLPSAADGDKRILLLDGEPIGEVLRLHAEGEELNNLDQGGSANATELTPRDLEICARVGPSLTQKGIVFAGIDVIGDYLMEVNVTSPTGIQEASQFSGRQLNHRVIQWLEENRQP